MIRQFTRRAWRFAPSAMARRNHNRLPRMCRFKPCVCVCVCVCCHACPSASASASPSVVVLSRIHSIPMMLHPSVLSCLSFLVLGHNYTLSNAQVAVAPLFEATPRQISFMWLLRGCFGWSEGRAVQGQLPLAIALSCKAGHNGLGVARIFLVTQMHPSTAP